MVPRRPNSNPKREQSIPVKVSIAAPSAPSARPPTPESVHQPAAPKKPSTIKEKVNSTPALRAMNQPVHEWPEKKRRKLMWWLVGGGMAVIVIGWLAVLRWEMTGGQGQNIFAVTAKLFKDFHWPGTAKPNAAEQEIRQLDQQVFPQFNQ